MSDFRTVVRVPPSEVKIGLNDRVLTVGSCFSEAIGTRLLANKISCLINPFGTVYNPLSVHQLLSHGISKSALSRKHHLLFEDHFLNYDIHSSFRALNEAEFENRTSNIITQVYETLRSARWTVITYGSAWVYILKSSGEVVANCHKQPSRLFDKRLLTIEEIVESFTHLHRQLRDLNPDMKIILTVSPVRHIKDTLELNAVSKSVVRVACRELSRQYDGVEYFPAYEIMMDDLRDYRFYKADMIHPTEQAEEYVWDAFAYRYFDEKAREFVEQWKGIRAALRHRPFNPNSSGHQIFLKQTLHKLEALKNLVNVEQEIELVRQQLLDSSNSTTTS